MSKKDFKGMNYDNFDRFLINFMGVNNSLPTSGDESLSHMEVLYKCYHKILECMKAVDCLSNSFQLLKDFVIEKLKAMEIRLQEIEKRQDDLEEKQGNLETLVNSFDNRISVLESFVENILTNEELFETIANYLTTNTEFVENIVNNQEFINNLVENLTTNETFITEIVNENFISEIFENAEYVTDLNNFIENYLTENPQGANVIGGKYIEIEENEEGEKVINSTGQAEFLENDTHGVYLKETTKGWVVSFFDLLNLLRYKSSYNSNYALYPNEYSNNIDIFLGTIFGSGQINDILKDCYDFISLGSSNVVGVGPTMGSGQGLLSLVLLGHSNSFSFYGGSSCLHNALLGNTNQLKNIKEKCLVVGNSNIFDRAFEPIKGVALVGNNNMRKTSFHNPKYSHISIFGNSNAIVSDNSDFLDFEHSSIFGNYLEIKNSLESSYGLYNKTKNGQRYSYGIGESSENRKNLFDGDGSKTNFYTNCNFNEGLQVNGVDIAPSDSDISKQFRTMYSTGTENSISDVSYRKVLEKTIPKSDIAEGFYHNFYTSVRINRINSSTHDGSTFGDDFGYCDLTLVTNLPSSSSATPNYYGQIILENKKGDTSEYNLADNLKLVITEVDNVYKVTLYIKGYKNHLGIITNDEMYRTPTGNEPIHWDNFTTQVLAEQPTTLPTGLSVKETDLT